MAAKYIEVTVRILGDDYKETVEAYSQRINYQYFQENKPNMVAQIAAVVNDLPIPNSSLAKDIPWTKEDTYKQFDKEYDLYKSKG